MSTQFICQVASMRAAVTFGFGFEAIADAAMRDAVMNRVMDWLKNAVAIEEAKVPRFPRDLELSQPRPDPCRGAVTLQFGIPARGRVKMSVYNCAGQRVKTLLDGYSDAGYATLVWDLTDSQGKQIANGTYFCKIEAGGQGRIRKLFLVR